MCLSIFLFYVRVLISLLDFFELRLYKTYCKVKEE